MGKSISGSIYIIGGLLGGASVLLAFGILKAFNSFSGFNNRTIRVLKLLIS